MCCSCWPSARLAAIITYFMWGSEKLRELASSSRQGSVKLMFGALSQTTDCDRLTRSVKCQTLSLRETRYFVACGLRYVHYSLRLINFESKLCPKYKLKSNADGFNLFFFVSSSNRWHFDRVVLKLVIFNRSYYNVVRFHVTMLIYTLDYLRLPVIVTFCFDCV